MTVSYVKFEEFSEDLVKGVHNLSTGALKIYLSNTSPNAATNKVKADLAEITNEHGYTAPVSISNSFSRSGATSTITVSAVTITASGGTVGAFQYVVCYNDTPTSPADPLISYWNYGSAITLADGETFTFKPNSSGTTGTLLTVA